MKWFELSERVLIIEHERTRALAQAISEANLKGVIDVVGSDQEVAVQYSKTNTPTELIVEIEQIQIGKSDHLKTEILEIPVCYELGEDLEEVLKMTALNQDEFIETHGSVNYQAAFGFIPGFIYLSGLLEQLHCPRKQTPKTKIEAGSVGIGGGKTGVYSLESPGGWQIVGRTPVTLFEMDKTPPTQISSGGFVKFVPISKTEFDHWNGGS